MSTANPSSDDVARLQEAADWVQQLNEPYDQELIDRWTAWCASDPRNVRAFESLQEVWDGFAGVPAAKRLPRSSGWMSVAAGVLLLVGVGAGLLQRYAQHEAFRTSPGEQRSVTLVDGSRLDLAPDTSIRVSLTPFRREVQLQRGQVFCAVSHSLLRSFSVSAPDLRVTAVGTAFDVRTGPRATVVTVSEGSVRVTPENARPAAPPHEILAGAGQRVTYSMIARGLSTAAVDPLAAESWRRGVLPFVGEPLQEVVSEINRYSARKIDIAPGFGQTRFTGTVSLRHVEDWLNALPQIFSVEVIDRGSNDIHIQSKTMPDVG